MAEVATGEVIELVAKEKNAAEEAIAAGIVDPPHVLFGKYELVRVLFSKYELVIVCEFVETKVVSAALLVTLCIAEEVLIKEDAAAYFDEVVLSVLEVACPILLL